MNDDVNELLKFYNTPLSDKLKKLAAPLQDCLGIDAFGYFHIGANGEFFQCTNSPEATECYFANDLYKSNPFIHHPDNYYNGVYLLSSIKEKQMEHDQAIVQEKTGYGVESFLFIYKKNGDNGSLFFFATKNQDINKSSFCFNNLPLLDKFCYHFLAEWKSSFRLLEKHSLNLIDVMGKENFLTSTLRPSLESDMKKRELFLKKLGLSRIDASMASSLTPREIDCLHLFAQGKTAKQVAHNLYLSPRTVENYLSTVKDKLCCSTKSELLECVQELRLLGILEN